MICERKYLEETIAQWIETVIADNGRSEEVIYMDKNGVRPPPPFIALQFLGGSRPGFPSRTKVGETGERKFYAHSEKTISVHGVGEETFDLLQIILDSIYTGKYKSFLCRKNLVVRKLTDVSQTGSEIDGEIESRCRFDIHVSFIRVVTEKPGWIENVTITPEGKPSLSPITNI